MAPTVSLPPDAEIRKILQERTARYDQGTAIVVGVIEPQGNRVISCGTMRDDGPPVDGDTVFEIGSITKVFTCLVLATMVERGEAALNDPVSRYLPEGVKVPERGGKQITLQDLATHTSGLPREPSNYSCPTDWSQPLHDYSAEELYAFLQEHELTRDIGVQFEYSNLGVALLGHTLECCTGADYETLAKTRILGPLGMNDTGISLTPA